jgi:hypothetical protein
MQLTHRTLMKKHLSLLTLASSIVWAPLASSEVLFSENFEAQVVGARPGVFDVVRPGATHQVAVGQPGAIGFEVVEAMGGQALRIWDYKTETSNSQILLEKNFVGSALEQQSAIRVDFSFQRAVEILGGDTLDSLYFAIGAFDENGTLNSQANRALELRLNNDGTFRVRHGTEGTSGSGGTVAPAGSYAADAVNSVSIFANSAESSLVYLMPGGGERILNANSFDIFINGSLVADNFEFQNGLFHNNENILGKIGFVSGSAQARAGSDFLIDDLQVSVIPEPRTYAILLGLAVLGLVVARKRRK